MHSTKATAKQCLFVYCCQEGDIVVLQVTPSDCRQICRCFHVHIAQKNCLSQGLCCPLSVPALNQHATFSLHTQCYACLGLDHKAVQKIFVSVCTKVDTSTSVNPQHTAVQQTVLQPQALKLVCIPSAMHYDACYINSTQAMTLVDMHNATHGCAKSKQKPPGR